MRQGKDRSCLARTIAAICGSLAVAACNVASDAGSPASESALPGIEVPPQSRLLSQRQYLNVIGDVFGTDIKVAARFPPVRRENGLAAINASTTEVTPSAFEMFYDSAISIAAQVVDDAHRHLLIPCAPAAADAPDDACARAFFRNVGPRLYRRPLREEELQFQIRAARDGATATKDFYTGLSFGLTGMLVSPKFLMVSDVAESGPGGTPRLDAYSRATRLSLFLWNAYPDQILLNAAQNGELNREKGVAAQVRRMLASPRFEAGIRSFFEDMLNLGTLDGTDKDPTVYPAFSRRVADAAKEQVLRTVVDHVIARDADYRQLFTTNKTFVTGVLAPIYKMAVSQPGAWEAVTETPGVRAGLLTQPFFLAVYAHPGRSSPTRRGKAFREIFLCQKVPDPPPNVNFELFDDASHKFRTTKERVAAHLGDPVCAGCHRLTDPIGLALENFDGAAQFREQENGVVIDASGQLDKAAFANPSQFAEVVARNPALTSCFVSRMASYAFGRHLDAAAKPLLDRLHADFAAHGYRVKDLMERIATSGVFFEVSATD